MIAIYVRQSIDKKDSISIESQIEKCKKEFDDEEYKVYSDKGYSGKNTDRPQFSQLVKDVEDGLIHKVIVYKIDRISRAIIDFANINDLFKKNHVQFVSHTEKFDTSSPMGNAMLNIIMVFAQLERETIQLRVKDNYYARGSKGFYLGGVSPYGYDKIPVSLQGKKTFSFIENKIQSKIVKSLFLEYASSDISLGKLMGKLNEQCILTNRDKAWTSVSLSRLLRNPVYVKADAEVFLYLKSKGAIMNNDVSEYIGIMGCYVYGERSNITKSKFTDLTDNYVTLCLHEGLISADTWLKCQYKLDKNKQVKNSGKGKHSWLSGIVKCGYCGLAINVVNNNRGNSYINCGGRKQKICYGRKRVIHISDIEEAVETDLFKHISNIKVNGIDDISTDSVELNRLKIERVQIQEKIDNIVNKLSQASEISMTYINQELYKYDFELKKVTEKILKISENNKNHINYDDIKLENCILEWGNYTIEEKKSLAKIFIKKVLVTDDKIDIIFN